MTEIATPDSHTRRAILTTGIAVAGLAASSAAQAVGPVLPALSRLSRPRADVGFVGVRPALLARARAALVRHGDRVANRDLIAVADYAEPSFRSRFYLLNMITGAQTRFLVAHGRGSDPEHSGWVKYFSNDMGSLASSEGAYLTDDLYYGKHGRSRRLIGLDPTNDRARERAVIVHGAWYVGPEMLVDHGKIGRSEGCFALAERDLDRVLMQLGPGHMIYADKG